MLISSLSLLNNDCSNHPHGAMIDAVIPKRPCRIEDRRTTHAGPHVTRIPPGIVTSGGVDIAIVVAPGYGRPTRNRQSRRIERTGTHNYRVRRNIGWRRTGIWRIASASKRSQNRKADHGAGQHDNVSFHCVSPVVIGVFVSNSPALLRTCQESIR